MAGFVDEVLGRYDRELRGHVPEDAPFGVVAVRDGPVVRWHFGTHGSVDHAVLPDRGLGELIARLQGEFASRAEPMEWRVHAHDRRPDLESALVAAGFTVGQPRPLLARSVDLFAPRPRVKLPRGVVFRSPLRGEMRGRLGALVDAAGPQRVPLADVAADGHGRHQVLVAQQYERVVGAGWAAHPRGSRFVVIGGMTGAYPEMVPLWLDSLGRAPWDRDFDARYAVGECGGAAGDALLAAGFRRVGTVTPYHWRPPGPRSGVRPARLLVDDPEGGELWKRFTTRFDVRLSPTAWRVFTAPPGSLTVHFGANDLDRAVERGLRALTGPGEEVFALSAHSVGHRFFPHRVGGPGQPPWPLSTLPGCCYDVCTTADLRMGVFRDAPGMSVTIFGTELADAVAAELAGADDSGVWSFGPG